MISTGKNLRTIMTGIIFPLKNPVLFHKMGGYPLLEEVVDVLYERLLTDQRISYFFGSNDMKLQRALMKSFLAKSLGVHGIHGNFEGEIDPSPFLKNGMTPEHIVIIMNHLRLSFLDLGVKASLVDEAIVSIIISGKEKKQLNPKRYGTWH